MSYAKYDEAKKVFNDIQQDLEQLKKNFPLGEKEFVVPCKQNECREKEQDNIQKKSSLDRIKEIIFKLKKNNIECEERIKKISNGSKKFYRMETLGKKNDEIIRFEKQRFLELRGLASKWNLVIRDPLSREDWDLLFRFTEWNSLKGRIWAQLCQPNIARIYISKLNKGTSEENNGQLYGEAFAFYGKFISDVIESFDISKEAFENYINYTWKLRRNDYYNEGTDALFRPRKAKDNREEKKRKYTPKSLDVELKDNAENGSFRDFIKSNELGVEEQVILRDILSQTIIELTGNLIKLKKDKTLYMPLFYTEWVVYLVKIMEWGRIQMRHERLIFEVMSQSFLDFFMEEMCRTILKIQQSSLKTYDEIGFKNMDFSNQKIDFPFRQPKANVYKKYIISEDKYNVSDASADVVISKNYKKFEKILQGLFDSKYKEEILNIFSGDDKQLLYESKQKNFSEE